MHIYIHIPFCKQKCSYCDFNSGVYTNEIQNLYIDSLIIEISQVLSQIDIKKIKTIYIGGGTPSHLRNENLKKLLEHIKNNIILDNILEYTIECNPESVDNNFAETIAEYGINRVSMGVQSSNDDELKFLDRIHNFSKVIESSTILKNNGIHNISMDLIYSLPNQNIKKIKENIDNITNLNPTHISCYSLIIEENTKLFKLYNKGIYTEIDDESFVKQYRFINNYLKEKGYHQYEISNYAKKGFEAIHNSSYWEGKNYIGIGISAHSKYNKYRYSNISSIFEYIECFKRNFDYKYEFPVVNSLEENSIEILDDKDIFNELIFLGLRKNIGIDYFYTLQILQDIENKYKENKYKEKSIISNYKNKLNNLIENELISITEERIKLTQKGREISNSVFIDLML